jgi:iron complex transport system permease protein
LPDPTERIGLAPELPRSEFGPPRARVAIGIFGVLTLGVCVLAPLIGSTPVRLDRVFDSTIPFADNVDAQIFFIARLPRVLTAAIVGCSLALSGVVFQALLRNPLASPDTLGVSAGASLGAMLAITWKVDASIFGLSILGLSAVPLASFLGSLGALAIVLALSVARRRGAATSTLLLAGVTLTALIAAVVRFVQFLADATETLQTARWMMGSLDVGSYGSIVAALVPLVPATAMMVTLPRPLDLLSIGDESAAARGVNVDVAERVALVSASLATGAAVSLAGPVAFVGIVVPHLVRLMVGAQHRLVLPSSGLIGAAFLVVCDVIARTLFGPLELPVGVVTALVGGPVFLWLLFQQRL